MREISLLTEQLSISNHGLCCIEMLEYGVVLFLLYLTIKLSVKIDWKLLHSYAKYMFLLKCDKAAYTNNYVSVLYRNTWISELSFASVICFHSFPRIKI